MAARRSKTPKFALIDGREGYDNYASFHQTKEEAANAAEEFLHDGGGGYSYTPAIFYIAEIVGKVRVKFEVEAVTV